MATDGPDPPPCDKEIYERGKAIGVYETEGANEFEQRIRRASERAGVKIDWHYMAGRAVVRCLPGDEIMAKRAVQRECKGLRHDTTYDI